MKTLAAPKSLPTEAPATLPLVRAQVREVLTRSPSFRNLPPDRRRALANDMVKVAQYIVGGESGDNVPAAAALAGAPAKSAQGAKSMPMKPVEQRRQDLAGETAGRRFSDAGAVAAQQGTEAFSDLVAKVDFPGFVAGLIDGVFNAIVDSSIKQMEAYAELVRNVAKTADEYMKDNVTENQARDYLAEKYPDHLEVDITGEAPRLKPRQGAEEGTLPDFFKDLGLTSPVTALDEDTVEQTLVPAARQRIAMDRQQLLATMVMMGINRLVVTNGHIDASVMFELDTTDSVKRGFTRTSDFDRTRKTGGEWGREGTSSQGNFWGNEKSDRKWYSKGSSSTETRFKVTTARSEDSTSKVEMHAKLGGKVSLQFKSDYFPLEKMTDILILDRIREKTPAGAAKAEIPA